MLIKAVSLFLVFIAVLGMFGKLRWILPRRASRSETKCSACGRHRIGTGPCACGKA